MFDKFKQATKIKDLQKNLAKEKEEVEKNGVKVLVNGQMKVEEIIIDESLELEQVQIAVKEVVNEALKNIQKKAAQKMQESGIF